MSTGVIRCEVDAGLATLWLGHPPRQNAMSRAMWRALRSEALRLSTLPGLRCIVLRGEGGHFCAGGNIAEYPDFRFDAAQLRHFHEEEVWGALQALLDCEVPLLACIEGSCMGAGVEIASCCDIRIATPEARFGAPIARLGFAMAPRELQLVLGQVGATVARSMLLEAASFDAQRMLQCGFLTRICPAEDLEDEVARSTARILALAPEAARTHKRMVRALAAAGEPALRPLLDHAYDYADSAEHHEGISAFLQKRNPAFADGPPAS